MQLSNRLLIIEDEPDWQDELVSMLSEAGYDCKVAADYATGLDELNQHKPSALVLDLKLRTKQAEHEEFMGWKLAERALKQEVPVVVVTGHPSIARANRAFREFRVLAFLAKDSLTKEELTERVAEGVEVSRQRLFSGMEAEEAVAKIRDIFYRGIRIQIKKERG
jgi:DNA-binding NtrC family response regulator